MGLRIFRAVMSVNVMQTGIMCGCQTFKGMRRVHLQSCFKTTVNL